MITASPLWTSAVETEYRNIQKMRSLFKGAHEAVFVTSTGKKIAFKYVTQNILGMFTKTLADLQLNQKPQLVFDGEDDAQKVNAMRLLELMNWWELLYPAAIRKSYGGYCDFKILWEPLSDDGTGKLGKPRLILWGANCGEFVTLDKWKKAVNFWYEVEIADGNSTYERSYKIRERHEILNGGTLITNTAYAKQMATNNCYESPAKWSEVATAWPEGAQPDEETVLPGMTMLPHYRMNNIDEEGDGNGDSDYHESFRLMQEALNIVISSRQFVIRCMEEPTIAADMGLLDESGNLDLSAAKMQVVDADGNKKFLDITNWSSHLPNSEFQWEALDKAFYKITCMSPAIDGDLSDASGYARLLGLRKPTVAAQRNRNHFTPALLYIAQCAQMLENYYKTGSMKPVKALTINWAPIFPDDLNDITLRVSTCRKDGTMSLETAVKLLHAQDGWTDEQIDEEIQAIKDEQGAGMADFAGMPGVKTDTSPIEDMQPNGAGNGSGD